MITSAHVTLFELLDGSKSMDKKPRYIIRAIHATIMMSPICALLPVNNAANAMIKMNTRGIPKILPYW